MLNGLLGFIGAGAGVLLIFTSGFGDGWVMRQFSGIDLPSESRAVIQAPVRTVAGAYGSGQALFGFSLLVPGLILIVSYWCLHSIAKSVRLNPQAPAS